MSVDRDSGAIHFQPLMKSDEGSYRCRAINDVADDFQDGYLTVIGSNWKITAYSLTP